MTNTVQNGKLIRFHFNMFAETGECLGGTEGQPPLEYIHGETPIDPPGLETYLLGKEIGHKGEVTLGPTEAYGERLLPAEESIDTIPLEQFPLDDVVPGMMFVANIGNKGDLPITIMDIQGDAAIVHYGHPLAGQTLRFEIEVLEVNNATAADRQRFGLN